MGNRHGEHLISAGLLLGGWLAIGGTILLSTRAASEEFEIEEATIEKGVQIEYRGAFNWGIPPRGDEVQLRNAQELEAQIGLTDWCMLAVTPGFEQPVGDSLELSSIELQTKLGLHERKGDGVGLAFQASYRQNFEQDAEEPTNLDGGPIAELAHGPMALTLNPKLRWQFDDPAPLGFEYAWQLKYDATERLALAIEMFGDVDDLAHPGSFEDQQHSVGPTLYFSFGKQDSAGESVGDNNERAKGIRAEDNSEFAVGVGIQFGLTPVTSDAALKLTGTLAF